MKTLILLILLLCSVFASENKKVTLQLNWLHQFQFAGYYIAKEKGYYKDYGIDVEIKEFNSNVVISDVIEKKQADFAVGRSSIVIDKAKGKDIVALFATFQNSPLMLLLREDSNIKTIQDLKNKTIMMTPDAKESAPIVAMLSSKKVNLKNINVIPHSFNLNDLINKKVDAMASYVSNEPLRLEELGIKYTIFHPKDYGFDFYSDILFTSREFINKNPELVRDFYEATEKGWEYAFNNIGKTAKLIYTKYNSQNKSLVNLVSEGEALKKLIHHKGSNNIGCIDQNTFEKIINIYKVMGLLDHNINLQSFIYEHNKHDALTLNLSHNELWNYILIILIIAILTSGLFFYFINKQKWLVTKYQLEQEIELKTAKLQKQTYVDFLTKARNKKAYVEKIREEFSRFKRYDTAFSMILFDIDDFKYINDTYGHVEGDKVLKKLVKIVKKTIRKNDFLFRVGGEEFVVIFPSTTLNQAKVVAEYIRKNIEDGVSHLKGETITISVGLCEVHHDDDMETIYSRVDSLMYQSKHNGKNVVSF